jgi:hypothetical protein
MWLYFGRPASDIFRAWDPALAGVRALDVGATGILEEK